MIPSRTLMSAAALVALFAPVSASAQRQGKPSPPATRVVAEQRFDIDGDGKPDLVRIEDPPAVAVTLARAASALEWKPFATGRGALVAGELSLGTGAAFGKRRVLVATALFRGHAEVGPTRAARTGQAMILAWNGKALDKLWEGTVGAQGRDNDYQVRVEASPLGLLRYQERPDIRRCDGKPAYLFPERFDFQKQRFRAVSSPTLMPENAAVLIATRAAPAGVTAEPAVSFRTRSVSAQSYADHAGDLVPPRELDDDDPKTAWQEGTGGAGRGVFITLTSPMRDPELSAVRIIPGHAADKDAFARANRLRRIGLLVGTERAFWIEFPDDPARERAFDAPYWVTLPAGVRGDCVTLVIDSVYPGRAATSPNAGDTAIAELSVLTSVEVDQNGQDGRDGPDSELIARVSAAGEASEPTARLLVRRGARALPSILAELEKGELSPPAALRLRRVLARIGDPAAAGQLVEGLAAEELSDGDRDAFQHALEHMGDAAVPALDALVRDDRASSSARAAAARVLAAMPGTSARDSLVGACGRGDRGLRQVIAVALGQRQAADFDALLDAATRSEPRPTVAAESDLWRAIGLMARRAEPSVQRRAAEALAERVRAPRADGYELNYRLLSASAGLAEDAALMAVREALAGPAGRDDAHGRALRRVTAAALAENPHPRARQLLLELTGDADPGVRDLAVAGLGPRADADADSDRAIIARLESEPWPRIRQRAAAALGHRCGVIEDARAALDRAVDGDAKVDVAREALNALVQCRAPDVGARLIAIAGDGKRHEKLRQRALTLVPMLEDPSLSGPLIALFARLRGASWSENAAVRLAAAAAVALGRVGTDDVVAPLMSAAREASFPEIQAAAVTALGEICPRQALPLMAALVGSDQRGVVVAAKSAYNRCR